MLFDSKELGEIIEEELNEVAFAFLFGSAKEGIIREGGDIDIGVFLIDRKNKEKVISKLIGIVEKILPGLICDIVFLNDAEPILAKEIISGKLLFVKKKYLNDYCDIFSDTRFLYEDKIYWMKKQLEFRGYEVQWDNRK